MEQTDKKEEMPYSELLVTLGGVLDPRIRGEIATGRRQIGANTYEDEPLPSEELALEAERYDLEIMEEIEREIEERGCVTLSMFTCPNGNAKDMMNKFSEIIPKTFDENQILIQRIALLRKIFREAEKQDIRVTLNIIIGDTDFLTYYFPTIEKSEVDTDLEEYFKNAQMYRDSLVEILRKSFYENGLGVDIFSFGDQDIESLCLKEAVPTKSSINVMSFLLNTASWGTEEIPEEEIEGADIFEEAFYTERRCCNKERFDPNVFAGKSPEVYEQMAKIKANEYRKQGNIVKELGGRIILTDELPPALKTRYLSKEKDLLFLFPWIRDGDVWKNQNSAEMEKVNRIKRL